jgi:uncharacterized protein YjiK
MQATRQLLLAALAAASLSVEAADSINLGDYRVSATYSLATDIPGSTVSGLEASAVTYAKDRIDPLTGKFGTLFFVGDEGTGVVEISRTGQTLGSMAFNWDTTGSSKHDTEGLTYLGGGVLVVSEERLQDAYSFKYVAGGTASLAAKRVSLSNTSVGNSGIEGISYDARNGGSFVTVKQENPQNILAGTLTFDAGTSGESTMAALFDPNVKLGLSTLSDVQTMSSVDALSGTVAANHLLVLSLGSRQLLEVDRLGNIKSSFDLASVMPANGIEGVTIDENGTIYLVAEQFQPANGIDASARSQLIVLAAPVPEPETYAMLLAGLGLIGAIARRRKEKNN